MRLPPGGEQAAGGKAEGHEGAPGWRDESVKKEEVYYEGRDEREKNKGAEWREKVRPERDGTDGGRERCILRGKR